MIHWLDDKGIISDILREVLALQNIDDIPVNKLLLWAQRLEAQSAIKEALDNIKEAKDFDCIRKKYTRR